MQISLRFVSREMTNPGNLFDYKFITGLTTNFVLRKTCLFSSIKHCLAHAVSRTCSLDVPRLQLSVISDTSKYQIFTPKTYFSCDCSLLSKLRLYCNIQYGFILPFWVMVISSITNDYVDIFYFDTCLVIWNLKTLMRLEWPLKKISFLH